MQGTPENHPGRKGGLHVFEDRMTKARDGSFVQVAKSSRESTDILVVKCEQTCGAKRSDRCFPVKHGMRPAAGSGQKSRSNGQYVARGTPEPPGAHERASARSADAAFAEKPERDVCAVSLYFASYHHCRIHKALYASPATAAGITDKLMTVEDAEGRIDMVAARPGGPMYSWARNAA